MVSESPDRWLSTVGAVALDAEGNLAAATSTGGTTNKRWGRVGDSPIIGAGTFADNRSCAVSATGHGEYFIRASVAHDISARKLYKGISLEQAAEDFRARDYRGGLGAEPLSFGPDFSRAIRALNELGGRLEDLDRPS